MLSEDTVATAVAWARSGAMEFVALHVAIERVGEAWMVIKEHVRADPARNLEDVEKRLGEELHLLIGRCRPVSAALIPRLRGRTIHNPVALEEKAFEALLLRRLRDEGASVPERRRVLQAVLELKGNATSVRRAIAERVRKDEEKTAAYHRELAAVMPMLDEWVEEILSTNDARTATKRMEINTARVNMRETSRLLFGDTRARSGH